MKTRLRKWGNSLACRIPKAFAVEAGLKDDSAVSVSVIKGKLVIEPLVEPEVTLKQLLARITPENLHGATDTGDAIGREIW
ncbi:MAG: AbrB/MazE/SpoVT family DNA-binding domain-containing protein [Chloroflexi bacterium]|nr:AbrB/MazE/SpoVT family DNA-binding domain-containing protein [Chloroflexota bacterium]